MPFSSSEAIEAAACEIAQPWPWKRRSSMRPSCDADVHAELVAAQRVVLDAPRGRGARARRSCAGACSARGCSRGRGRPSATRSPKTSRASARARRSARRRRRARCRRPTLARAVAPTPRQRISGCAQWWPARMQTPSRPSSSATSWGWMPSIVNEASAAARVGRRRGPTTRSPATSARPLEQRARSAPARARARAPCRAPRGSRPRRRGRPPRRSSGCRPRTSTAARSRSRCCDVDGGDHVAAGRGTAASARAARGGRAARRCRSGRAPCGRSRRRSRRRSRATSTGICGTAWAPSISDDRAGGARAARRSRRPG